MGIDNSGTNPFGQDQDVSLASDSASESGSGGGDMTVWSASRETQLTRIARGTYTNNGYDLPKGITATGFSLNLSSTEDNEVTLSEEPDAEPGDGGDTMAVWSADRMVKVNRLALGDYTNESNFGIPAAVTGQGFTVSHNTGGEEFMGTAITGQSTAPSGLPLDGTVELVVDGTAVAGSGVSGSFVATFSPPGAITTGEDGGGVPTYDARYTPNVDGLSRVKENISYPLSTGFSAHYGVLAGYVYDYQGDPVQNVVVSGKGSATQSDESGYYALLSPGGSQQDLTGLEGSVTKTETVAGGESARVDWQFGGIEVRVYGPDLNPIRNAPVQIGGDQYRTDETGRALLPQVGIGSHDVSIMESFDTTLNVTAEGQLKKFQFEGGSRLTVRVYDAETGDEIVDLSAIDATRETVSFSDNSGKVSLLAVGENEFDVLLGQSDNRYQGAEVEESLSDGSTKTLEVLMDRKTAITNV